MSEQKLKEAASLFVHAAKETPAQMFAPFVAAWRELVKNAEPSRSDDSLTKSSKQAHTNISHW
jgi:hypothetical protein